MKYLYYVLFILFIPIISLAQINDGFNSSGPVLEIKGPVDPNSTVVVSLNDYSSNFIATGITWKIDGIIQPDSQNLRSITVKTPDVGLSLLVEAELTYLNIKKTISTTLKPIYLDLIVEPQTKSPSFYQGRSLPTFGSEVFVSALISGISTPSEDLIYTWKLNNSILFGGPIRGKQKVVITIPSGKSHFIAVNITNLSGKTVVERSIEIPSVEPVVYFYEKNALYGLSNRSFNSANLTGNVITIKAEPYHLDLKTYNNPDLIEWEVDRIETEKNNSNPYELTLSRPYEGFTGISQIEFQVRNLTQLLQGAKGSLRLNY